MKGLFFNIVFLFAFLSSLTIVAQESVVNYVQAPFGQYTRSLPLINPASMGTMGDMEFFTGNQRQSGSWSGVNTYYINANLRIPEGYPIAGESKNFLGIKAIGDKEGDFINRNRVYGMYAYNTRLTRKIRMAGALSLGMMNFYIKGTDHTGSSSVIGIDGDVGLWLYSDEWFFGTSINQLMNSEIQPFNEITRLQRNFNIIGGYDYIINEHYSVKTIAMLRYIEAGKYLADLSLFGAFDKKFSVGLCYRHKTGMVYVVGVDELSVNTGKISVMLSYSTPFANTMLNINTFEITAIYWFDYSKLKKGR